MKPIHFALLGAALALAACAGDNVTGRALSTGETFTGSSSAGLIGGGSLSLQSSKGAKCEGRTMGSETIGSSVAVITCDDGRAGSVVFIDGPGQSVGRGVLGDDQVTLTIEK
ncbi:MAG TPA: hypothetical protein VHA35_02365 [Dongiaceae bacterium]|nr:hypothetical protein [Dongiaceae bacterium]